MNIDRNTPACPRWLHVLAVLTVLLTLPLLFLGAGVTSYRVGMVDPVGFRWPWEIVRVLLENDGFAIRLEYGHRLLGFAVGFCGIAVAIGCWRWDERRWLGWFALLALTLICIQGLLGKYRVDLHELYPRTAPLIHGAFAQIVFAVLVSLALFTSRRWRSDLIEPMSPAVKRWSLITVLLVFAQLILGSVVRHTDELLGPRGHLLGAFVVVAAVVWLLKLMKDEGEFRVQRILLKAFLVLQLWLGVESWLAKFYVPTADLPQLLPAPTHAEWIRTAHYLVGTLIFATTVTVALIANRKPILAAQTEPARPRQLEGAL